MDKVLKSLPGDNAKYYIEHDRDRNTFKIKEDACQHKKR